jgi:hypothetical protein
VTDQNQTGSLYIPVDEDTSAAKLLAVRKAATGDDTDVKQDSLTPEFIKYESSNLPDIQIKTAENDEEYDLKRPKSGGIAFPFTIKGHQTTASMTTLTSAVGVLPATDLGGHGAFESGLRPSTNASANASSTASVNEPVIQPESDAVAESSATKSQMGDDVVGTPEDSSKGLSKDHVKEQSALAGVAAAGSPAPLKNPTTATADVDDDDRTPVPSPGEKVVVGGEVFGPGERPHLESFVTAQSHLTLQSAGTTN